MAALVGDKTLQGEGAVATWRRIIGATDPEKAHPESLRARFARHQHIIRKLLPWRRLCCQILVKF